MAMISVAVGDGSDVLHRPLLQREKGGCLVLYGGTGDGEGAHLPLGVAEERQSWLGVKCSFPYKSKKVFTTNVCITFRKPRRLQKTTENGSFEARYRAVICK